jgi:signal transduction histidine kinase
MDDATVNAALRAGANDYVLKGEKDRLLQAVERLLRESRDREVRAQLLEELWVADRIAATRTLAMHLSQEIAVHLASLVPNLEAMARVLTGAAGSAPPDGLGQLDEAFAAAEKIGGAAADLALLSQSGEPQPEGVELERIMSAALRLAEHELRPRARVLSEVQSALRVQASGPRLTHLLMSLVAGAAQLMPEGDPDRYQLRVTAAPPAEGMVQLVVEAKGVALSPETVRALFGTAPAARAPAAALGLGFCHVLARELGGGLHIAASLPERGPTFTLTLPVAG